MNERISNAIREIGSELEHTSDPAETLAVSSVLEFLARFAHHSSMAKSHRQTGNIQAASRCEDQAERFYKLLHEDCKW